MDVRGSVGLTHARRKKSVDPKRKVRIGHGRSYGCQQRRCASLELKECNLLRVYEAYEVCLMLHALRSEKSVPPKVDSKVSRRSLLPLGLTVLHNHSQLAGACSCGTCLRARMVLSRAGVVRQMERKA
jgi:hypothetical protein